MWYSKKFSSSHVLLFTSLICITHNTRTLNQVFQIFFLKRNSSYKYVIILLWFLFWYAAWYHLHKSYWAGQNSAKYNNCWNRRSYILFYLRILSTRHLHYKILNKLKFVYSISLSPLSPPHTSLHIRLSTCIEILMLLMTRIILIYLACSVTNPFLDTRVLG